MATPMGAPATDAPEPPQPQPTPPGETTPPGEPAPRRPRPRQGLVRTNIKLRSLLVLITLVTSAVGLLITAGAVNGIMKSYVVERADHDLINAAFGWAGQWEANDPTGPPTGIFVARVDPQGGVVVRNEAASAPSLSGLSVGASPITVPARKGSASDAPWRIVAFPSDGATTVVARSLENEQLFLHQLFLVQMFISSIVLTLMGLISFLAIRRAFRPLRRVEGVASAIARGEFEQRLPETNPHTEVGQLSLGINKMVDELEASIRQAQDKEEQMRRFVGDASHELRTPLTSVRGYAELYRSGAAPSADYVIERISGEAERMTVLVEDLLSLARSEGNTLKLEQVDLLEMALSVAATLQVAHPGRSITVNNSCDQVPLVTADPLAIRRVMINLVNNALVHGGPEAQVTVEVGPRRITVSDDGVGMSEEDAAHVFERFYRSDASRSRESGGSGLGLAIVKSVLDAHGAAVSLDSAPGQGARFTIDFAQQPPAAPARR